MRCVPHRDAASDHGDQPLRLQCRLQLQLQLPLELQLRLQLQLALQLALQLQLEILSLKICHLGGWQSCVQYE